ncbi:putative RNA-binding protein [Trypanosoma rangeli]|uniref:Putative RNA-binding protein n=1 Tax=Trypanosoma rangeli TaxID=5698 RepID=A0A3R7LR84_TRYRA|nr:putative RNA-binding protein [Trypanosoma rangeli]RNF01822.1 putative RNA-binding protein [Trypanosoma rangeli]|eukprot:RNF01822.1 putative RNA-binding protein [Trypanosoma rangeli]
MSRAPRNGIASQRYATSERGVPYKRQRLVAVSQSSSGGGSSMSLIPRDNNTRGPRRLTFNNFDTFNSREKKLPPDANAEVAPNTKLWQLQERASFYCNKCRRDNIISDTIAVDAVHQLMLCTRCFIRIIRPRSYRPSRVVPFPSLLSWLNYKPSKVMEMSEDISSRPAEAVAPSGERIANPTLGGGDRPAHIQNLPAIAMNTVPSARGGVVTGGKGSRSAQRQDESHPCIRVWGSCVHGETCMFCRAPYDLCIAFLMGLCPGDEEKCHLLHQKVFSLPNAADPMPLQRRAEDVDDAESEWGKWIARRKNSPNSAEWQLWHNGPVLNFLNVYAPVAPEEDREKEEEDKEKQSSGKSAIKLNFADISAALQSLKQ